METLKEENEFINRLSFNTEEAIERALDCYRVTTNCLQHCLSLGGRHADLQHITLMKECAEICRMSAEFLIEKSEFAHDLCGLCAKICDTTADHCQDIAPNDVMMNLCVTACRNCAESCRNMEH